MNILINASNLRGGGGAQVCDSICRYLCDYKEHKFVVVLSQSLDPTAAAIKDYPNVVVVRYSIPAGSISAFFTFRNAFLDHLVSEHSIECVFTVFGPIKWRPRVRHVSGFGLSHIVMPESPYFQRMRWVERLKWWRTITVWKFIFYRSADIFITENPLITNRLQRLFSRKKVVTITNNYNQVFDHPENQKKLALSSFDGITLLSIASAYPHKNLPITIDIARIIKKLRPEICFRFVLTIKESEFPDIDINLKEHFLFVGRVSISECPSLYEQCDICFAPTLLECFTAAYPEAMRMHRPIVTPDLEFSKGICGDGAIYYDADNANDAAAQILKIIDRQIDLEKLYEHQDVQLASLDNSKSRASKSILLCSTK